MSDSAPSSRSAVSRRSTSTPRAASASRRASASRSAPSRATTAARVDFALATLERKGTPHWLANLTRFAITTDKAFGVSVADLKTLAKELGRDHELALALWETGWYEARMLATLVDEPERVTRAQMDAWCRDFDNWGICDTACFHLFDRTPYAWAKIEQWCTRKAEFEKRAGLALLASVALHDKELDDAPFVKSFAWIERAASDERNFVKKGASWALRGIGMRNRELHEQALEVAQRLIESKEPAARWVGRDVVRELSKASVLRRLDAKKSKSLRAHSDDQASAPRRGATKNERAPRARAARKARRK